MPPRILQVVDLARCPYPEAYRIQQDMVKQRLAGAISDTLILVEHPHVFTIGRGGSREHLLVEPGVLEREGITVYEIDRGGDITYHGPGQIVGYPIINLKEHTPDIHLTIRLYEEAIIRVLHDYGLEASREPGYPGVWVNGAKVAAIGIGIRRWVTYHGFAFNIYPDLRFFQMIVPCGITDRPVTSMTALLRRPVDPEEVKPLVVKHLAAVFDLQPQQIERGERAWPRISLSG